MRSEILRKIIHFAGLIYIPAYIYFGRDFVLVCVVIIFFIVLILEVLRIKYRIKYGVFANLFRNYERRQIGAHVYFGIAILIITPIFPLDSCLSAVTISLVGDGTAGIFRVLRLKKFASISMFSSSLLACTILSLFIDLKLIPILISCCLFAWI